MIKTDYYWVYQENIIVKNENEFKAILYIYPINTLVYNNHFFQAMTSSVA